MKVPEKLNDAYYRRQQLKKPKQGEGEIFDTKKEVGLHINMALFCKEQNDASLINTWLHSAVYPV